MDEKPNKNLNWITVLNEHSEWRSQQEIVHWFSTIISKDKAELSKSSIDDFTDTLTHIRSIIYRFHFNQELELNWINAKLAQLSICFQWPNTDGLPILRAKTKQKNDEGQLQSLTLTLILQFCAALAESLNSQTKLGVQRCEGLYRDPNASVLSMVPNVTDKIETLWRAEIPVLVEQSLEKDAEIQRCADLFPASSRSKYCSDSCRFSTFQIVKQLKEPDYLAEKQRRYRKKKQ